MAQDNKPVIRVTAEDLAAVSTAPAAATPAARAGEAPASYGNINAAYAEMEPARSEEKGSFLLQGWFYLGAAGLLGATAGWGICEPSFIDEGLAETWGNVWMMPLVIMLMVTFFAVAESVVERSVKKAASRLLVVVPLGVVFGFVFSGIANVIYNIGLGVVFSSGVTTPNNPSWWIARAIGWAVFGVAGGRVYGIVGKSGKKAKYGVIGGVIGAGLGGLAFDPIAMLVDHGDASRCFGFGILGLATGAAMGFVESALKDRWLYVSGGPLAGKQFILYKSTTTLGSDQSCDIYLFKDSSILPQHAVIELRGTQATLRATQPVFVGGVPATSRVLLGGDIIQLGRYSFRYNERHR